MFAKQQAVSDLNKARDAYNAQLQKGKEIGLDEAAQTEPVPRSEKDTHDIQGTETVHGTVPKRSVDPKCIPKAFIPGAPCDTSVHDVLRPQPFQDSIATAQQTAQEVGAQKNFKERQAKGNDVKTSVFKSIWKTTRPWLELRRVPQDDHEHWSENRSRGHVLQLV